MNISYSAPAKIILSGEHASVYGKPMLLCAIDKRLTFSVTDGGNRRVDDSIHFIPQLVKEFLTKKIIEFEDKPFQYSIDSDIPMGQNLGSSAALSVAGAAAFLHFYTGRAWDKDTINSLAYKIEQKFHGKPSGGDNSTSCFGGLVYYRKEFEFLKTISSLSMKFPNEYAKRLFIIDSGKPVESTREMVVNVVGGLYNKKPQKMEIIFNSIEKITKRMVLSIATENINQFREAIIENEKCLEEIGAVSKSTQLLLQSLEKFGVGKIMGGGGQKKGSGNILYLAEDIAGLKRHLSSQSIPYFQFTQDFDGVKIPVQT
jgi:mevalonate kinase